MPTVAKRSGISRRGVTGAVGKARRARPTAVESRLRYIESSALVAALLEGDMAVVRKQAPGTKVVTSALTFSEVGRAIITNPTQLLNLYNNNQVDITEMVGMLNEQAFDTIVLRAQFYPPPVLDAIGQQY